MSVNTVLILMIIVPLIIALMAAVTCVCRFVDYINSYDKKPKLKLIEGGKGKKKPLN